MNQISGLGLYTVLQLCWTALPALMAGNARLFLLAGQLHRTDSYFDSNIKTHTLYFIDNCIFIEKYPLMPEFTLGAALLIFWLFLYGYITNFLC